MSAFKAKDALYTLNNVKVNSTSDEDYPIAANTDYKWNLTIDHFDQSFNHGTVLEVPMPDNFVLNTDATNSANNSLISNYNASIVQEGKNIKVSLPQLSTQKLKDVANLTGYYPDFTIIGQFNMDVPKGNTILATTDEPNIIQQTNSSGAATSSYISPVSVTITGQDRGLDHIPAGDVFTGTIAPDRYEYKADGSIDKTKPVTAIEENMPHDLNKGISVRNVTPHSVNNITMTINVPDGMEISGLSTSQYDSDYKYTFVLTDGTTQSGSVVAGSPATVLQADNGKTIKSIKIVLNTLDPFESSPVFGLNGVLAKKYSDGSDVKVGNNLHTDLYVTAGGLKNAETPAQFTQNQIIIAKIPVEPEIHFNKINGSSIQNNKLPDVKNAGWIRSYGYDLLNKSEKLTYYVVLPTNAELLNSDDAIIGLPKDSTVTRFKANGRTIVKITGNFIRNNNGYQDYWQMNLNNSSIITQDNLTSNYQLYVVLPEREYLSPAYPFQNIERVTDSEKLPFVENSTNAYLLSSGTWNVIAATGVYSASLARGNKDFDLISNGESDDKGSSDMTFSNILVNSDSRTVYGTNIISHAPGTDDGKSEFDFKLKNANSVQVVNINTGAVITDGVQNYYSTEDIDLTKVSRNDSDLMTHFVTADKITDWSKIRTVWTKISTIPKKTIYGVNLNGYDPEFKNDVNKTAYSSFVVWTDLLNHLGITPGGKGSASIKITGQSTINFKLHFEDNSQPDILVPDAVHTYKDGIDTVNQTDFIKATKNSDFDNAVEKKVYSLIPKAIMDAIPEGYVLDIEKGPSIENSNTQYPNGMVNGTAEFGKVAMYDFDGDTVIYNLVKKVEVNKKIYIRYAWC